MSKTGKYFFSMKNSTYWKQSQRTADVLCYFMCLCFQMYITFTVKAKGTRLAKPVMSLGLMCLAFLTGINRVAEYRNHWSDVIAGFIIGVAIATFLVSSACFIKLYMLLLAGMEDWDYETIPTARCDEIFIKIKNSGQMIEYDIQQIFLWMYVCIWCTNLRLYRWRTLSQTSELCLSSFK